MLTLIQIYQALKEVADLALTAKDLPDLVNQISGLDPEDVYLRALEGVLKQEQEVFLGKRINFDYDISIFKKKLRQNGVDFQHLAVSPEILNEQIGKHVALWILADDFLMGVDIGVEVDAGWAERVTQAVNERYANLIFEKLFNDAVRQELQFIAKNVKDNRKVQDDIKQLLELSKNLVAQIATDYTALNSKVIQELFGVSASLIEFNKITPASQERLNSYYQGDLLWWDIIVANGDVERDLQEKVLNNYTSYPDSIKMICIAGEPGSGKSTLAWRITRNISINLALPIIHLRDNENEEFWYLLENGINQYGKPVIVLVDDIFRNTNITRALASINLDLPVIIISTSRSNEIPDDLLLHFEIDYIFLQPPTGDEVNRAIKKTERQNKMKPAQIKNLKKVSAWLVLMYEITTGEELSKRIRDSVRRLKKQDEAVYRAYEYLCFAGQYDLGLPVSLLERLDNKGEYVINLQKG